MNVLLDSSVFISYLNSQDPNHFESNRLIETLSKDKELLIIMPVIVFLEVANVLSRQLKRFDHNKLLSISGKYETVELTFSLAQQILPIFKQLTLKTSDAVIVAAAKLTDAILITWDQKLKKEATKLVKTKTPAEFSQGELL